MNQQFSSISCFVSFVFQQALKVLNKSIFQDEQNNKGVITSSLPMTHSHLPSIQQ